MIANKPKQKPIRIFLPILVYNRTCHSAYMMSILKLVCHCLQNGIEIVLQKADFDSLVSRCRNAMAATFMGSDCTHLLFIDGDIEFEVEDVMKLIRANKDIVCAGYAQKWMDLNPELVSQPNPTEIITRNSVHLMSDQPIQSVMEAKYATTGFLLIRREVFDDLRTAYPERKYMNDIDGYAAPEAQDFFYNFFAVEVIDGRYESEDYGFSRLCTAIGKKVYVITDIVLAHHGWYGFRNNLYRQLVLASGVEPKK